MRRSSALPHLLAVLPLLPWVAQAQPGGAITGPAPGVLCDQAGPVCYDRQGPSIALTKTYFGKPAAQQLSDTLRSRPPVLDFRLSNGAVCDIRASSCWSDGWSKRQIAPRLTQQLFGTQPSNGSTNGNGLQGLVSPQSGVVCDPAGQICYDQAGLSLGLTRTYYGALAEQTVLRNLNGQAPPKQFRLSNGSACDVMARTCWSDGWSRQTVNTALSQQLFPGGAGQAGKPAQCRITRWFKVLASGNCTLRELASGKRSRVLEVQFQDGATYTISRPTGGSYQLTDPKGAIWPLQVRDQGTQMSFIYSDRVLSVTPQGRPSGAPSLGQLIDSLLSP